MDVEYLEAVGFDIINDWAGLSEIYIRDGEFVKVGDVIKRPKLAATLQKIADEGAETFYDGTLADDIATELSNAGGTVTLQDLKTYRSIWRDPLVVPYQYNTLHLAPPPFGGVVMGMAMNIIEHDEMILNDPDSIHIMVEAWKWAFGDRLALGDPSFTPNIDEIVETMLSKDHAQYLRSKIMQGYTFPQEYYSDLVNITSVTKMLEDHGTMHLNTADTDGNMVSLTSTVNLEWGSKFVGPITGIVFNNQMDDFATPNFTNHFGVPPAEANYIAPGKRPLSSMNPVIISKRNNPFLAVGASGGTKIITAPMQCILNILSHNLTVGDAVAIPRLHDQLVPEILYFEEEYDTTILDELEERGHIVSI